MEGYQTEEQKLAALITLWKKYRVVILTALAIAVSISLGVHLWKQYENKKNTQASKYYQEMLLDVQKADNFGATKNGELLLKKYSKTPYASLAGMILARISIDEKDIPTAIARLRIVTAQNKHDPLWYIAKLKLARLLYANKEYQDALKELDVPADRYVQMYEELKGDIYVALNDLEKARVAYKAAITAAKANGSPAPQWLDMKLSKISTVDEPVKKQEEGVTH